MSKKKGVRVTERVTELEISSGSPPLDSRAKEALPCDAEIDRALSGMSVPEGVAEVVRAMQEVKMTVPSSAQPFLSRDEVVPVSELDRVRVTSQPAAALPPQSSVPPAAIVMMPPGILVRSEQRVVVQNLTSVDPSRVRAGLAFGLLATLSLVGGVASWLVHKSGEEKLALQTAMAETQRGLENAKAQATLLRAKNDRLKEELDAARVNLEAAKSDNDSLRQLRDEIAQERDRTSAEKEAAGILAKLDIRGRELLIREGAILSLEKPLFRGRELPANIKLNFQDGTISLGENNKYAYGKFGKNEALIWGTIQRAFRELVELKSEWKLEHQLRNIFAKEALAVGKLRIIGDWLVVSNIRGLTDKPRNDNASFGLDLKNNAICQVSIQKDAGSLENVICVRSEGKVVPGNLSVKRALRQSRMPVCASSVILVDGGICAAAARHGAAKNGPTKKRGSVRGESGYNGGRVKSNQRGPRLG